MFCRCAMPTETFANSKKHDCGMISFCLAFLFVVLMLLGQALPCLAEQKQSMSPAAKNYLLKALNIIKKQALNSESMDFNSQKLKALELARGAKTPQDTYPAIRHVLAELPDHHSALVVPQPAPETPGRFKLPVPAKQLEPSGQIIEGDHKVAYLLVPGLIAYDTADIMRYAERLRGILVKLENEKPEGWIVDLRSNTGGNNWPMLAALGPLFGSRVLGYFRCPKTKPHPWIYEDDKISVMDSSRRWLHSPISASRGGRLNIRELPPVAVLISRNTISAGEIVCIAFKGRPNTRFFGNDTCGLTTAVYPFELPDHAVLFLAVANDADRNGHCYPGGISPDQYIMQDTQGQKDSAVESARDWISSKIAESISHQDSFAATQKD